MTQQGKIKFHIKRLYWRGQPKPDGQKFPPFDHESMRTELGAMLQKITRTPPPPKSDGVCSFMVSRLGDGMDFERFRSLIEWMIAVIRKS